MVDKQLTQRANDYQIAGTHYKKQKINHWDYVLENQIPYMEAQVIKYVSRWRDKNGLEDLHKAQHYLVKLIEYEEDKQRAEATLVDSGEPTRAYVDQGRDLKQNKIQPGTGSGPFGYDED